MKRGDGENRESCDMVRVADGDVDAVYNGPAGTFCWVVKGDARVLWSKLPGGSVGHTPIRPANPAHPSWEWDGNEDKPTLKPSVHAVSHWHGYFTAGRMVSQ